MGFPSKFPYFCQWLTSVSYQKNIYFKIIKYLKLCVELINLSLSSVF